MSLTAYQERWIDCVVDMSAGADDHLTAHYVFVRKVLGEPRMDALRIAHGFRHVALDREKCVRVADGWDDDLPPAMTDDRPDG